MAFSKKRVQKQFLNQSMLALDHVRSHSGDYAGIKRVDVTTTEMNVSHKCQPYISF